MKQRLDLIIDIIECAAILLLMIWIFVSCKSTEQIELEEQQKYNNTYLNSAIMLPLIEINMT